MDRRGTLGGSRGRCGRAGAGTPGPARLVRPDGGKHPGVAEALEAAAAKADQTQAVRDGLTPSEAGARWAAARNVACTRGHTERPRSRVRGVSEEIGTFARWWLGGLALDAARLEQGL